MNVLVFNCGSSSLKYRLLSMPGEEELAGGEAQRVGPPTAERSRIVHRSGGTERTVCADMADHGAAFREVIALLGAERGLRPDAVGHRVVHGGERFGSHALLDDRALADLRALGELAPIHNPPQTAVAAACRELYPQLPQVLVFDTAFHAAIPERARTCALPAELREGQGLRKYGFHGISHGFVAGEAARFLGRRPEQLGAVSCHLGSGGASLCAIVGGRSVDNTMGYSPLQGLVMSTRCGDLDPAAVLGMIARQGGDVRTVESRLNSRSGVLGLSGRTADIRDLLAGGPEGAAGREREAAAVEVYLWRLRKYLGAYLTVVASADAVIFTDTVGETVPEVRAAVCAGMEHFGLALDAERNADVRSWPADVATEESSVRILVIRTNEELAIARVAQRMLDNRVREGRLDASPAAKGALP